MQYLMSKDLERALQQMEHGGGDAQKKADKVDKIIGACCRKENPLLQLKRTKHGESRIQHCVKYDLGAGYRLITITDNGLCLLAFSGNHDQCDKWLRKNTGATLIRNKDGECDIAFKTIDFANITTRTTSTSDKSFNKLINRLTSRASDTFLDLLPGRVVLPVSQLSTLSTDQDIDNVLESISDKSLAGCVHDVLVALREGSIDKATTRLELYLGDVTPVEDLDPDEVIKIKDGEQIKILNTKSSEYAAWISHYIKSSSFQDWMLFMHPKQERIATTEFNGPTKLSGVSGSGKTCIIVKRAMMLALKQPELPILVLTLNKSLAALINELLDHACPTQAIRKQIKCCSFFSLCQALLHYFEPFNDKIYSDVTWKTETHVDEVWREYYRCECNNNDAEILFPIHKSLNKQHVFGEEYLKQEFDWIRSVLSSNDYASYYTIPRSGRAIQLNKQQRELILQGLETWTDKMEQVGVIDAIGLSAATARHLEHITPKYSSILVDEIQDFGTIELAIIRKLVTQGQNDLFFAGDMAQHISPRHQNFSLAGITVPGARSFQIQKNYRNGREILRAAYELMYNNTDLQHMLTGEVEILDPEYANFSSLIPSVLETTTLDNEIAFSLALANDHVSTYPNHKVCIAITGYSLFEVSTLAKNSNISLLDGSHGLLKEQLFLSDLEQTKGYEFDLMIIVNCSENTIPSPAIPPNEHFRDACKLYVAMTRAKSELILSYHGKPSPWLITPGCIEHFDFDHWDNFPVIKDEFQIGRPKRLPRNIDNPKALPKDMTGKEFLRTHHALGLSTVTQDKIATLIDGETVLRGHLRYKWKNILSAYEDVKTQPHAKNLFGPKGYLEFITAVEKLFDEHTSVSKTNYNEPLAAANN